MELWPHQQRALGELLEAAKPGQAVCVVAPTGAGKTRLMAELIQDGRPTVLYTNRRMLLDQTAAVLTRHGIRFGVRAAGYDPDWGAPVQLSSIQTEDSRVLKRSKWELHRAELVLIDEAHVNRESTAVTIIGRHIEQRAAVVGFTATPLGLGHVYTHMIQAGTVSELQTSGILTRAAHFAPDEPDCRKLKRTKTGEYTQADIVKAIMTHSIFGRVVEHWRQLNTEQHATLLFAPGVKESLWFAEQFTAAGIPAAHIDGNDIWHGGRTYKSDQQAREAVKQMAASGDIKIVCNRFVMREGIDWPFVRHIVFATIFGALTSYLQSGGRGMRSHPGKELVVVQDHGGNWWRHGSLNADRQWSLDRTDYMVCEAREERLRTRKEPEPICCPVCHAIRLSGPKCMNCGHQHTTRSRLVVQHDGRLKEVRGDIFMPRREYKKDDAVELWKRYYFRARNADMTFNQARGLFAYENNWKWPPAGLPLMPTNELDWFRAVKDVPPQRLLS